LMTPFVITKRPTDIFSANNIPVISVIWSYTGLPAHQIAQRTPAASPSPAVPKK